MLQGNIISPSDDVYTVSGRKQNNSGSSDKESRLCNIEERVGESRIDNISSDTAEERTSPPSSHEVNFKYKIYVLFILRSVPQEFNLQFLKQFQMQMYS